MNNKYPNKINTLKWDLYDTVAGDWNNDVFNMISW